MNEREKTIRLWFDMWLNQQDMGIDDIFPRQGAVPARWAGSIVAIVTLANAATA